MTSRICKFGCGVLLEGFDEINRKYIEAGTGGLHTKERCEEAKAKLRTVQGEKNHNNHGNEFGGVAKEVKDNHGNVVKLTMDQGYIDHTQPPKLKLKILTDPTPEGLSLLYNSFGESHNIRFSQYHPQGSLYTIAVFFEEVPLKQ